MLHLLLSDLHLTDSPRDEYRWKVFKWLNEYLAQSKKVQSVWLLGDLTDAKDYHSSRLVNRVVEAIAGIERPVSILRGNHDGLDPDLPYFKFLRALPNVTYYHAPKAVGEILAVPHTRKEEEFLYPEKSTKLVFMHATFSGAASESGITLAGLHTDILKRYKGLGVFSGDVHVPQDLGIVTYVGSPYHVHFGDSFEPRALLVGEEGKAVSVPLSDYFPRRVVVDVKGLKKAICPPRTKGDQCKVRLHLPRYDVLEAKAWRANVRKQCEALGYELVSIETVLLDSSKKSMKEGEVAAALQPEEILKRFSTERGISDRELQIGLEYLK